MEYDVHTAAHVPEGGLRKNDIFTKIAAKRYPISKDFFYLLLLRLWALICIIAC